MRLQRIIILLIIGLSSSPYLHAIEPQAVSDPVQEYRDAHAKFLKMLEDPKKELESSRGKPERATRAIRKLKKVLNAVELESAKGLGPKSSLTSMTRDLSIRYSEALYPIFSAYEARQDGTITRCQAIKNELDFTNARGGDDLVTDEEDIFAREIAKAICPDLH